MRGPPLGPQDIPSALAEPPGAALNHFVDYGQWEGRPFSFTCGTPPTWRAPPPH